MLNEIKLYNLLLVTHFNWKPGLLIYQFEIKYYTLVGIISDNIW